MFLFWVRKKSANNHVKWHLFLLLVKKSIYSLTLGSCLLKSAIFLSLDFVSLPFDKLFRYPSSHKRRKRYTVQGSCFMYLCNRFSHPKNVVGVRLVIGIIFTTHIASTIQQDASDGTAVIHGERDMSCRLFLNRDLLLDLLCSTLEQMAHGFLVTGHCNTCSKSSFFSSNWANTLPNDSHLSSGIFWCLFFLLLVVERVDLLFLYLDQ